MNRRNSTVTDVAIIGAGITGALTAYFSARAGLAVTLIERGKIGGQASGNNPGGLNPLHGPGIPGPMGDLALYAFRLHKNNWEVFAEHSRIDFAPGETSRIQLLQEDGADNDVAHIIDLYEGTNGFGARILDREDLISEVPRLHPGITRGIMLRGNACVDAHAYTLAVTEAAISFGAVVQHDSVVGLVNDGMRVTELTLGSGHNLACRAVVVATGPWVSQTAVWLDLKLPVEPIKGQLLKARIPGGIKHGLILGRAAIYPVSDDVVYIGGTAERVGFDTNPNEAGLKKLVANCSEILPEAEPEILNHFAGLRPITPDGMPVVGRAPGWENAYIATGAGYKGMLLSAAMASAVVDLIADGATDAPIGPCAMERFN